MTEQIAQANGIELAYETFGSRRNPALLLIMGLARQMIYWDEALCEMLAARGLWVIRFDHRDVGHSTFFDDAPLPDFPAIAGGDHATLAYTLDDMAADSTALLSALGIEAAHVVGASMGGMIGQLVAIHDEERVLSLASMGSKPGPQVGRPSAQALRLLLEPVTPSREGAIDRAIRGSALWGSPGTDPEKVRRLTERALDRSFHPQGTLRHTAAFIVAGDRTAALHGVRRPTVVVHGDADRLVDISGGRATARAIPDATLIPISGMGHDLPAWAFETIVDAIVDNAARAPSAGASMSVARRLVRRLIPTAESSPSR